MSAGGRPFTSAEKDPTPRPRTSRQVLLLLVLWWRHMRRRAAGVGAAPRTSGVPAFLLINLLSIGYIAPLAWRAVTRSMSTDPSLFFWHMGGVLLAAYGTGVVRGAGPLQVKGTRNDAFLEALPLTLIARLGLQITDGVLVVALALVVPVAGSLAEGGTILESILRALLGAFGYVASFVVGSAVVACVRAFGPAAVARFAGYAGIGLNLIGMTVALVPIATSFADVGALLAPLTRIWFAGFGGLSALYAATTLVLLAAYRVLFAVERRGFDRGTLHGGAPRALKGAPSRARLEWHMMWRQGGKWLPLIFSVFVTAVGVMMFQIAGKRPLLSMVVMMPMGLATYLGALQTIGQAGRAVRADVAARPFLCALPLSPHQVLDGKSRALRTMLTPIFLLVLLIAGICTWHGEMGLTYRALVVLLAIYVVVDGAISLAFLSTGIGVVGIGGGQASSSFSTQLLMMPLLTTVMAANAWAASVSCIAVCAVTWEARRAASLSVRWLDDTDDLIERETTVWRALLATTAFFAMQILSARLLDLFDVPAGYILATTFGVGSIVLVTLTWRNNTRFERPSLAPHHIAYWPLGILGGGMSGFAALRMAELFPKAINAPTSEFSVGESAAVFITLVVLAPLAEEYFFRGWLQKAIAADLPAAHKHWAFVLGAFAFALAHVGTHGIPQLVLGLIAGALVAFGGGLWPAILAHAVHNTIVLMAR